MLEAASGFELLAFTVRGRISVLCGRVIDRFDADGLRLA